MRLSLLRSLEVIRFVDTWLAIGKGFVKKAKVTKNRRIEKIRIEKEKNEKNEDLNYKLCRTMPD